MYSNGDELYLIMIRILILSDNMRYFFIVLACICVLIGCTPQEYIETSIPEKTWSGIAVAIIPHHMLTRAKVDEFYMLLQREYPHPDRIVIISPNHYNY